MTRRDLKPAAPSVRAPQGAPTVQSAPAVSRRPSSKQAAANARTRSGTGQQRAPDDGAHTDETASSSLKLALIAGGVAAGLMVIGAVAYLIFR